MGYPENWPIVLKRSWREKGDTQPRRRLFYRLVCQELPESLLRLSFLDDLICSRTFFSGFQKLNGRVKNQPFISVCEKEKGHSESVKPTRSSFFGTEWVGTGNHPEGHDCIAPSCSVGAGASGNLSMRTAENSAPMNQIRMLRRLTLVESSEISLSRLNTSRSVS